MWCTSGVSYQPTTMRLKTSSVCNRRDGPRGPLLVESQLLEMGEARALAADYLELVSERGEPHSKHPWPPSGDSPKRSQS
jgi:hypothetical protein